MTGFSLQLLTVKQNKYNPFFFVIPLKSLIYATTEKCHICALGLVMVINVSEEQEKIKFGVQKASIPLPDSIQNVFKTLKWEKTIILEEK